MSCLNLRLPKARKAWWKRLTSKIQSKLHKLNKPKAITKPRNYRPKIAASRPCKFLGPRLIQRKLRSRLAIQPRPKRQLVLVQSRHHVLEKSHTPVYVDKLFKESHVVERVGQHVQALPAKSTGTSKEAGNGAKRARAAADDMWEAMGFASPQMHGIDERAEQFIAKFRAEMKVQEMLARNL